MEDLVQVWVPKVHLADVYALVARLEAEREQRVETETKATDEGTNEGGLGPVEMREQLWLRDPELLRRMYMESSPGMLKVLNYLADNTDRWIPTAELHAAIEPGRTSKSSPFGPFSRRVHNRYGMPHWPFAGEVGYTDPPGQLAYRMGEGVAEQIKSYRKDV